MHVPLPGTSPSSFMNTSPPLVDISIGISASLKLQARFLLAMVHGMVDPKSSMYTSFKLNVSDFWYRLTVCCVTSSGAPWQNPLMPLAKGAPRQNPLTPLANPFQLCFFESDLLSSFQLTFFELELLSPSSLLQFSSEELELLLLDSDWVCCRPYSGCFLMNHSCLGIFSLSRHSVEE